MRRPGSCSSGRPHSASNTERAAIVGDVTIAGQLVRERAHVAGALDIVLAAERVHADAWPADIAGRHGEVGDRHHRGRALAVLGDAEAVVDRGVAAGGVEPRRVADSLGRDAGDLLDRLRAVPRLGDEGRPLLELVPVAALADEGLVRQAFGDDDMGHRRQHRDIGAGAKRQVIGRLDMRHADEVDAPRVDDDEPRALAEPLLHPRCEDRDGRRSGWRRGRR